jgi:hypothetical protein
VTELSLFRANPVKDLIVVRTRQHHLRDPPIRQIPQSCPLSILSVQQLGNREDGVDQPTGIIVRDLESDAVEARPRRYPSLLG